jgi:hypothetical protein
MTRQPKLSGRKPVARSGRAEASYRRPPGQRQAGRIIVIVCEGKETEPRYFEALKRGLRLHTLRVIPSREGHGSPATIIKTALQKRHEFELDLAAGDQVWCVFDTEQQGTYRNLAEVLASAKKAGLRIAASNPAFEYWYLLHFECTNRPFVNAAEVLEQLRHHLPQYTKSFDIYVCLKDRTEMAVTNAATLRGRADQNWDECPNPSTAVNKLVQQIWSFAGREDAIPSPK